MKGMWTLFALSLLVVAGSASAETVSVADIVKMANQGVGEELLLATVEGSDGAYNLTAEQIVTLKQVGVPEKVIVAMLRKKGGAVPPPVEVVARAPGASPDDVAHVEGRGVVARAPGASPAVPSGWALGALNLENVDDLPWAYRLDPHTKILWIAKPDAKSEQLLPAHGGVSLSAPAGAYEVRYVGEETSNPLSVVAGQTSLVLVSRVDTQDFEGLYVSVFEQGDRKGGGRLAILRQTPRRTIGQPQAAYQYIPASTESEPSPQTVERVVVEPSTTVIYRPAPVYVPGPYYYGPGYYGGPYPCHPWNRTFFRYGSGYRHYGSGWSVGFGIGF